MHVAPLRPLDLNNTANQQWFVSEAHGHFVDPSQSQVTFALVTLLCLRHEMMAYTHSTSNDARYYRSISSNTKFPKAFPETEAATQSHGPCALLIGPKTNTGRLLNGKLGQSMDQGAWPFPYGWYCLLIEFAVGLRHFVCLNRPFWFEFCPHSGLLTCLHFCGSDSDGGFNVCLPSRSSISSHHSLPCHSPWVPMPRVLQR